MREDARFNDSFESFDLRVTKSIRLGARAALKPIVEVFNLFNVTNILGVSDVNYSGFSNALVRELPVLLAAANPGQSLLGVLAVTPGVPAYQLCNRRE
jgi:hypothetical protein